MSSDSDEDELLQMALKEQSTRDLGHQIRGSSPRPSPANHRGSAARTHNSAQRRRPVDDDGDSEVEMLSISSGDEDEAKDGVRSRVGSRGGRDDDKGWDGGEPDCWKRVDESEV